jgi:hypothetical protein
MAAQFQIKRDLVTPAEIERITGLGVETQRVWRRRGYLPGGATGHARFDIFDIAAIMVRHELSKRGMALSESLAYGAVAAPMVVWSTLMYGAGVCEVVGEAPAVDQFEHDYHFDTKVICPIAGVEVSETRRYLLVLGDDPPALEDSLSEVIEASAAQSGYFVNLDELGRRLGERAGRPLLTVEVSPARDIAPKKLERRRIVGARR